MAVQHPSAVSSVQLSQSRYWSMSLFIFAMTVVMLFLSRLPAENFADVSPFWPVTAMAVVLLWEDKRFVFPLSLALVVWSHFIQQNPLEVTCLLPLTLIGPFLYLTSGQQASIFLDSRNHIPSVREYWVLLLFAVIPSSLIGSLLYSASLSGFRFLDTFFVYSLTEFLGVLIFTPLTAFALHALKSRPVIQYPVLATVFLIAIFPAVVSLMGSAAYTNASIVLLFPLFALSLKTANQNTLILASFMLSVIVTFTVAKGVAGGDQSQQIQEFLFVTFWLIALLIATQVIHRSTQENLTLLHHAEFQANHNEHTNFPNKRQLSRVYESNTASTMVMVQVKERASLNQSYNSADLMNIEQQLAEAIQQRFSGVSVFHIAEMRFALMLDNVDASRFAELQELNLTVGKTEIYVSLAWGLASMDNKSFDEAISFASAALSLAMLQSGLRVFGPSDEEHIQYQLDKHARYQQIMDAIERDQVLLHCQPIMNLEVNEIQSGEILARILMQGEMQSPFHFIPLLTDFDALGKFDRCVVSKAFHMLKTGSLGHLKRININITGATLSDAHFMTWLDDLVQTVGRPQQEICFEITESDCIRNWAQALNNAQSLVDQGFLIAIDDFGAGLASFEYLQRFTMAHIVKLDGAFVKGLAESDRQKAYVAATMEIAKSHGLAVCAEFVDNQASVDYLKECGVTYAQGFYIGKPSPVR